jgi:protein-serine/threonine kinase
MSANKNRHTIQVEYDGEASYEKMKEILEAKRVAAAGSASVPSLSLNNSPNPEMSPHKRVLELQAVNSDIEMESESSDQGHTHEGTMESYNDMASDEPTPEASHLLTPPPAITPPVAPIAEETPSQLVAPSTPTRKGKEAMTDITSPSTPRAAKANPEDIMTPRAHADTTTPRAIEGPRSGGKRFESMPARSPKHAPLESTPAMQGLNASGLPQVPAPKRDRYRKGMSLDKFGLAKLLGSSNAASSIDVSRPPPSAGVSAAALQNAQNEPVSKVKKGSSVRPRTADGDQSKDKKNRRRTLQLMVNRCVDSSFDSD